MDPSDFSVQQKAEKLFGVFPYELPPTKNYLFTLYRFYLEEQDKCKSFAEMTIHNIKHLGDMIGFQNYQTCVQSIKFIRDWAKKTFEWSDKTMEQEFVQWNLNPPQNIRAELEIEKIYDESCKSLSHLYSKEEIKQKLNSIFDQYDELMQHREEWIVEPPHPARFVQYQQECQVQIKKLKKSLKKTNHPLAEIFHETMYGKYIFTLDDSFPIEYKTNYLNLCLIHAFHVQTEKMKIQAQQSQAQQNRTEQTEHKSQENREQ